MHLHTNTVQSRSNRLRCLTLSALHSERHPDLRTGDGIAGVDLLPAAAIPMIRESVTGEALASAYVNGTPAYLNAKSARRLTARSSKYFVCLVCVCRGGREKSLFEYSGAPDSWLNADSLSALSI